MNKKIVYLIVMAYSALTASAQESATNKYMIGLNAGVGVSALKYEGANMGTGFTGGADFGVFFTPHFGVSIGLGYTTYKSDIELNETYTQSVLVPDANGDIVAKGTYDVSVEQWKEEHTAASIDLPIQLLLTFNLGDDKDVLIGTGLKCSFMRSGEYEVTDGTINASCKFDGDLNVKIPASEQDLVHHNLGLIDIHPKGVIDLKTGLAACFDLSVIKGTGPIRLMYGVYGSVGLNNIVESKSKPVMDYYSGYTEVLQTTNVEKVVPVCLGVKIGLKFAM